MRPTRPSGTSDFGRVVRGGRARLSRRATVGAAVAALVAPLAVAAPTAGAVVNGTPSGPAPWAVQITTFSGIPGTPCSGVVVAPYWVATAKHCGPANPNAYTLGFGNQATVPGGFAETASLASPSIVGAFGSL
ncbi:trypsin-like serine protease, partial [Dietzia psychralcaliphila]